MTRRYNEFRNGARNLNNGRKRSVIRITRKGLDYLVREGLSEEEIIRYPGGLQELCDRYDLIRGEHYTLRRIRQSPPLNLRGRKPRD